MALLAMLFFGCSNDTWRDATGQLRGDAEFKVDHTLCEQAGDAAQSETESAATANCTGSKCRAIATILSPTARPSAIDDCLVTHGWQKVATLPAPSLSEATRSAATKEQFPPIPGVTRVFVFGIYSSFADKAFFGTTYELNVNDHRIGTFSQSQFLEFHVTPGNYALEVREFGWLGTFLTSAGTTLRVNGSDEIVFVAIPTSSTNIGLEIVDADYGMQKVADRKRVAGNPY
jgi:hypothetical protein